ncbi:nucleotidyltransferase family protein [Peribacillus frigoritolerans]|uniref:nucleotidyltransferase domain-containing protein n=1 Tax=Peribacillus frigoritolerans TaxID=450367 RepID=UPI002E1C37C6|nr:nucleotidyltransferase family protein [Peribacillus frigoritolerans]
MDNNFNLDLELLSKELSLLIDLLKMEEEKGITYISKTELNEIDWDIFLDLVCHHRVYSLISSKFKSLDEGVIPLQVINSLRNLHKENTLRMLHLTGEMEQISKLFLENNIPILLLKGPVIAADLYGDISLRTSRDLDILIPIDNLKKADQLLLKYGFEREEETGLMNEWKYREHHFAYFHPQKNIILEIHWRMQRLPSKEPRFKELWERKRISKLTTYPVYYLGEEDLFLYLISHGARHGWFRLRWLLDIDKTMRKMSNFTKVKLLLESYNNLHIVGQALILASQLLNTPIQEEMKILINNNRSEKLAQKSLYFINCVESLDTIMSTKYYKRYLFSLKSNQQKIIFMLIFFYPSKADANTLMLPGLFHFLYFPLRPFLWAWRKTIKPS